MSITYLIVFFCLNIFINMKSSFIVLESEKKSILSMYDNIIPVRYKEKTDDYSFKSVINQIINELSFQKQVHLHSLSIMDGQSRINYLNEIQDRYIINIFNGNKIILENYRKHIKSILTESIVDFSNQIDRFNGFLINSLLFNTGVISEQILSTNNKITEQPHDALMDTRIQGSREIAQTAVDSATKAYNYIKENGIGVVFENIREALLSGVGQAIQFALSFTGVGSIANEIVWAIMLIYDAYQHFINRVSGSLANMVIDIICLMTSGNIGTYFKGLVNTAGTTISGVLKTFMNSNVGRFLQPLVKTLGSGFGKFAGFLDEASKFMLNKMKLNFVVNVIDKVKSFFTSLSKSLKTLFASSATNAVKSKLIQRAGVSLSNKFEADVFKKFLLMGEQELSKYFGSSFNKALSQSVQKYVDRYLKERPTQEALYYLDKYFGTKFGDAYALYLDAKKLAKHQQKLVSGSYKISDFQADLAIGNNTFEKPQRNAERIKKNSLLN